MQGLRVVVRDDFEDDRIDMRCAEVVVFVFRQHDGLPLVPAFELIWARADGGAEERGFLHVFTL